MFDIARIVRGNDHDVAYVRSLVELYEGFNELLPGVKVQRLTSNDSTHTYRIYITINTDVSIEEFLNMAALFAQGNIEEALERVEALKARYMPGRITREPLG